MNEPNATLKVSLKTWLEVRTLLTLGGRRMDDDREIDMNGITLVAVVPIESLAPNG